MGALTEVTRDEAMHFSRQVEYLQAAMGVEMSPTAGHTPYKLRTLAGIGRFLQPLDDLTPEERKATVHYVNPIGLAQWVSETIGDAVLGAALAAVAEDGRPYAAQVHDLKRLIEGRLEQYDAASGDEEVAAAG